jgi:hypothetical protein
VDGTGQYTSANTLAAYQAECDATATFVPVELDGGPGTRETDTGMNGISHAVAAKS